MVDWPSLLVQTLKDLRGDEVCVPGAKLHSAMSKRALESGGDLSQYLLSQGKTFREFVEENRSVEVHRRLGMDMLVGLPGASLPQPGALPRRARVFRRLRDDVYGAFTRIGPVPYLYYQATDTFTMERGEQPGGIEAPIITLDTLLDRRRGFAESMSEDNKNSILDALKWTSNPLAAFYRCLAERGLLQAWYEFSYGAIRDEVCTWAKEKGLAISEGWFAPSRREPEVMDSPQRALSEIAKYMTDEEVRSLTIPFRAVEEMLRSSRIRRDS